jgi:hypothetical protein
MADTSDRNWLCSNKRINDRTQDSLDEHDRSLDALSVSEGGSSNRIAD